MIKNNDDVRKLFAKQLPKDDNLNIGLFDAAGKRVTKEIVAANPDTTYYAKLLDTADDALAEEWNKYSTLVDNGLPIKNMEVRFDSIAWAKVSLSADNLSQYRDKVNFKQFRKLLAEQWSNDPSLIPDEVLKYFDSHGIDPEFLEPKHIKAIQQYFGLTIHESADRQTLYLVSTIIHSKVSHSGGVSVVKWLLANSVRLGNILIPAGAY